MRVLHAAAVALLLPMAAMADEPTVAVECLCVESEHGWVIARSNATMADLGLDWAQSGSTIVRFTAASDGCGRYPSGCADERYKPTTGEVRTKYQSFGFTEIADDYRLTIQGDVAE